MLHISYCHARNKLNIPAGIKLCATPCRERVRYDIQLFTPTQDLRMKGYLQLYTGDGKGKTTAALGLALRAAGAGIRVFIAQFIKGRSYCEDKALEKHSGRITIKKYGRGCFIRGKPQPSDITAAQRGIRECESAIVSGSYGLVILDEAAIAAHLGLFPVSALVRLADLKPSHVELVITGRCAHPRLVKRADLVTEMKDRKHYYRRGVKARRGIDR